MPARVTSNAAPAWLRTWPAGLLAAASLMVLSSAHASVTLTRPTVDERRVDRCADGQGAARCERAARERVADETCRAQGRGFTGALTGSVRYEGSLLPRTVAVWSDELRRFVEGRGVDVIASVVCIGPEHEPEPSSPGAGTARPSHLMCTMKAARRALVPSVGHRARLEGLIPLKAQRGG